MAIWYRFQTLSWKEANWIGCHCHVIIANRAKVNLFLLSHKLLSGFLMVVILVYASFPKKIRGLLFRNMVALSSCDDDGKMGIKSHGNIKTSRLSSTLDNDSRLNIFHRNFSLISIKHVHVCSLGCLGLISWFFIGLTRILQISKSLEDSSAETERRFERASLSTQNFPASRANFEHT